MRPKSVLCRGCKTPLNAIFPIVSSSGVVSLDFKSYELREPMYDMRECKERGLTYQSSLYAQIDMVIREKKGGDVKIVKSEQVYMGDMPMMTSGGSFIINALSGW